MNLIDIIRRHFLFHRLKLWRKGTSGPMVRVAKRYANGVDRVFTDDLAKKISKVYVKRHYEAHKKFVDVFWYIKPSKSEHHIYTLYYRCSWEGLRDRISKVENSELPKAVYYAFNKKSKAKDVVDNKLS